MTDKPRLTAAQYDTLARTVRKPLCRTVRGWMVVGSHQHVSASTVERLLSLGYLHRCRGGTGATLLRITDDGRARLGLPASGRGGPTEAERIAGATALHERIAP